MPESLDVIQKKVY